MAILDSRAPDQHEPIAAHYHHRCVSPLQRRDTGRRDPYALGAVAAKLGRRSRRSLSRSRYDARHDVALFRRGVGMEMSSSRWRMNGGTMLMLMMVVGSSRLERADLPSAPARFVGGRA
jgi:hypothetical protein